MLPRPIILMVHGFGGSGRWWDQQKPCVEAYGSYVAVDLPGHGGRPWQGETLELMADQILDSVGVCPGADVIAVGSSFGGLVVLKLWQKRPDIFRRIVLVGSLPRFVATEDFPAGLTSARIGKLLQQLQGDRAAVMAMFFRSLFTQKERLLPDHGRVKELYKLTPVPSYEALEGFLGMLANEDLRDVLAGVDVPVRLILGDADPICPLPAARALERLCPSLSVDVLEGCGHFPFLSQPGKFNEMLDGFIKGAY